MGISKPNNGGIVIIENTFDQLTAAASQTDALLVEQFQNHTFQILTAAIVTNVVVRIEGSLDNTNWFNMDDTGGDTTITSAGTIQFNKKTFKTKYVRVNFVSEAGGTTATIDVKYMGGN